MTDRLGFILWPALAALTACAITRPAEMALISEPPSHLTGEITTQVEWLSSERVMLRCAAVQSGFGKLPLGGLGCTYANAGGPITLVLPYDLHPLVRHELGHAHQLKAGVPVTHEEYR